MRPEQSGGVLRLAVVVAVFLAAGFAVGTPPPAPAFRAAVTAAAQNESAVEASLGLDRSTRRLIQQGLRNEGFDAGAPDGLFGPQTRNAIRRWQEARGVLATGYLDGEQAELLRAAGAPAGAGSNELPPPAVVELPAVPAEAVTEMPRHAGTEPVPAQAVAQGSTRASPPVAEASNAPAPERCETWNGREFFETATVEEVTACLAAGADVAARDDNGRTPLFLAALLNKNPAVVEALLTAGADVGAPDGLGRTPLFAAAGAGTPPIVAALLAAGADLKARADNGYTPLHQAARDNEDPAIVQALLAAGADVGVRDDDGRTPVGVAARHDSQDALEALLAAPGAGGCEAWNTGVFFKIATVADVAACLEAGANVWPGMKAWAVTATRPCTTRPGSATTLRSSLRCWRLAPM